MAAENGTGFWVSFGFWIVTLVVAFCLSWIGVVGVRVAYMWPEPNIAGIVGHYGSDSRCNAHFHIFPVCIALAVLSFVCLVYNIVLMALTISRWDDWAHVMWFPIINIFATVANVFCLSMSLMAVTELRMAYRINGKPKTAEQAQQRKRTSATVPTHGGGEQQVPVSVDAGTHEHDSPLASNKV